MSKKNSTRSKKSEAVRRATDPLAYVAILIAAVPLFFFDNPLSLYTQNILNGFYGIAIWPSSVLAGYAFYRAVEFSQSTKEPWVQDASKRTFLTVLVLVVLIVFLSFRYQTHNPWLKPSRDALMTAIAMFAGLRFLDSLFYQGLLQGGILEKKPRVVRILAVPLVVFIVHAGFVFAMVPDFHFQSEQLWGYIGTTALGATGVALLYEAGWSVIVCAIVHAIFGAAFIWFQQLVFA